MALQSWVLDVPSEWKDKEEAGREAFPARQREVLIRLHLDSPLERPCGSWTAQRSQKADVTTSWGPLGSSLNVRLTVLILLLLFWL